MDRMAEVEFAVEEISAKSLDSILSGTLLSELPAQSDDSTLFYRGHSRAGWKLQPSLFRNKAFFEREDRMNRQILASYPNEFSEDKSCLERLARMQHYGLPTRILDVTTNVLSAIFFCCADNPQEDGELICIDVNNSRVKNFDSDAISCVANLSNLSLVDRNSIDKYISLMRKAKQKIDQEQIAKFNKIRPIGKLHHFICSEKPYFIKKINPLDLYNVKAVLPRLTNRRLHAQSGAFLIFGVLQGLLDDSSQQIKVKRVKISRNAKKEILYQLDRVGINVKFLFPEIEKGCEYIKAQISVL